MLHLPLSDVGPNPHTAHAPTLLIDIEARKVIVEIDGEILADSAQALRVREIGRDNAYYIPRGDVRMDLLRPSGSITYCPMKGLARFWSTPMGAAKGQLTQDVAWSHDAPTMSCARLRGHIAFDTRQAKVRVLSEPFIA